MNARQRKKVLAAGKRYDDRHRTSTRMKADPIYRAWIENRAEIDQRAFAAAVSEALREAVRIKPDELPPWQTRPGGIRYRGTP